VLGSGHTYRHRDKIIEVVSTRSEGIPWYVCPEVNNREARRTQKIRGERYWQTVQLSAWCADDHRSSTRTTGTKLRTHPSYETMHHR
jgi:hypothetical protein